MNSFFRSIAALGLLACALPTIALSQTTAAKSYEQEQVQWRQDQEKDLKQADGWLTLAGLFWLKEGRNTVGGSADSDLVFPGTNVPPVIGAIDFQDGTATFTADPKAAVTIDGKEARTAQLSADITGKPTIVRVGTLSFNVIKRGPRYGVRLRDSANPRLTAFTGMKWFPVQDSMRIVATFTKYETPHAVKIMDRVGNQLELTAPGLLSFKIGEQELTLEPVMEDEKLFIIFRDLSSGKETYGAGRFLYADAAVDGKVILDFNQAVNPPCAFTPYATCPLPPARNSLKVAIRAGEIKYHDTEE